MMRHTALFPQRSGSRLLLALALCALLLRGLIPAGYMPASGPDYAGALTFCVQAEPGLASWSGQTPQPVQDGHAAHPACLFGQAQAQGVLPLSDAAAWAPAFLPVHTWNAAAPTPDPLLPMPGPAVGARAPPALLLS